MSQFGGNEVKTIFTVDSSEVAPKVDAAQGKVEGFKKSAQSPASGQDVFEKTGKSASRALSPISLLNGAISKLSIVVGAAVTVHKALVAAIGAVVDAIYAQEIAVAQNEKALRSYADEIERINEGEEERRQRAISQQAEELKLRILKDESIKDEEERLRLVARVEEEADIARAKTAIERDKRRRDDAKKEAKRQAEEQARDEDTEQSARNKRRQQAQDAVDEISLSKEEKIAKRRAEIRREIEIAFNGSDDDSTRNELIARSEEALARELEELKRDQEEQKEKDHQDELSRIEERKQKELDAIRSIRDELRQLNNERERIGLAGVAALGVGRSADIINLIGRRAGRR